MNIIIIFIESIKVKYLQFFNLTLPYFCCIIVSHISLLKNLSGDENYMQSVKNMTSGSPLKILFSFALPLMVGNVFQQLYTMVDSMVVGNQLGLNALSAIGNGEWLNWLVLSIIQAFSQGFSIRIAQNFGANDIKKLRKNYVTAQKLSIICTVAILCFAFASLKPILHLLNTPDKIFPITVTYLKVIFAGIPIVMAYNFLASVLRSLGDSRTPLKAMIVASLCNIVLDLLFVIVFQWGVAGAAAATLIGQAVSAVICYISLSKIKIIQTPKNERHFDGKIAVKLLKLAMPFAFQNVIISVGGLVVQSVINGYGVLYIAGFTATNKLYGLLEIAAISYGFALTTYVSQNYGANEIQRITKGVNTGALMGIVTAIFISVAMFIFGRHIVGAFISGNPKDTAETIKIAYHYLCIMAAFLPVLYLLHIYRSSLQGLGDTIMPMVSGGAELVMRILAILFLPKLFGTEGLFWAEVLAWAGADVVLLSSYYVRIAQIKNKFVENNSI